MQSNPRGRPTLIMRTIRTTATRAKFLASLSETHSASETATGGRYQAPPEIRQRLQWLRVADEITELGAGVKSGSTRSQLPGRRRDQSWGRYGENKPQSFSHSEGMSLSQNRPSARWTAIDPRVARATRGPHREGTWRVPAQGSIGATRVRMAQEESMRAGVRPCSSQSPQPSMVRWITASLRPSSSISSLSASSTKAARLRAAKPAASAAR